MSNETAQQKEYPRDASPVTDRLVAAILATSLADLPSETMQAARTFLVDSMVTGVGGKSNPASENVLAAAVKWDGDRSGDCRVLGRRDILLSPHSAAMVNGFQIHCLEWDALHEPSVVIALCANMAALLSEAQVNDHRLDDVLLALTIGVETAVFFGAAATGQPRFFRPSAAGTMGAAVAIGRLRKFDAAQMTDLLGLAYSQVSGTMQAHWEGSEALPMQIGFAARAALTAADLVEAGLTGPHDVVAGKFGYFNLIEPASDLELHFQNWGKPWKITEVAHKPFPAGRATQATLTAIMDMREQSAFTMDEVESITAHVPSLIMLLVGRQRSDDMRAAYARLCLEFVAPMMIREGRVDPRLFTNENFASDQVKEDSSKVHAILDSNPDPNALSPQNIIIRLKDGQEFTQLVDIPFGSPGRAMTRADELAKAAFAFELGGVDIDPAEPFAIVEQDSPYPPMREIMALLTNENGR